MSEREYVTALGRIYKESELTPELREELRLDENGNRIADAEEEDWEDYYESEDDLARGEGFWVDDDGNWIPMEDDDW